MSAYYADDWLTVYQGDARTVLSTLPDESVHCVVTSPPYWGLRDYGTATWDGGDAECDHLARSGGRGQNLDKLGARLGTGGGHKASADDAPIVPFRDSCRKCGATRVDSQIGLEPTPDAYVAALVGLFRELRRVLRPDGTLWLNLGDSYASHDPGERRDGEFLNPNGVQYDKGRKTGPATRNRAGNYRPGGLKPKDLVGIPWRVAFALQADGWYLRSDIIWAKPNPMPESVTDRPTKSHEYLFLLSKSARYYYDAGAVREAPLTDAADLARASAPTRGLQGYAVASGGPAGQPQRDNSGGYPTPESGRNLRSVWTVATQPYPGAHFATFPRKLVEPCIKAGCPPDGTVLDPFAGSGTTGMVAQSLSRRAILIDLNADYLIQAMGRNRDIPLGLVG